MKIFEDLISQNIQPYIIKEVNGLKVGILGIVNSAITDLVPSVNVKGIEFENSAKSLEKWIDQLEEYEEKIEDLEKLVSDLRVQVANKRDK